jgi:hypothetical protein
LSNYDAGILISINSGIVGHSELEERYKDGKIILYIPSSDESCIGLYYSVLFVENVFKFFKQQRQHKDKLEDDRKNAISEDILDSIITALHPVKYTMRHYSDLYANIEKTIRKVTKDLDCMRENIKETMDKGKEVINDSLNNIILSCGNREMVPQLKLQGETLDALIYNMVEEDIPTPVGVFTIRIQAAHICVYEKSTNILVQRYRHAKSVRSKKSAYHKCKTLIEKIGKDKKYRIRKKKEPDSEVEAGMFIPRAILQKQQ